MTLSTIAANPEALHPSLWRASQLARSHARCIDTGHPSLSNQLPGGGWPLSTLTELMVRQAGVGELRFLAPALMQVADRKIVLMQPPHVPQALALAALGLPPASVVWVKAERTADQLWAAEQVLRSGSCGALLFWQNQVRNESARRLHLAAQSGETLFFMMRPQYSVKDASPAPLRLGVNPAPGGVEIEFLKRRGPQTDETLFLPMHVGPITHHRPHYDVPRQPAAAPGAQRQLRGRETRRVEASMVR